MAQMSWNDSFGLVLLASATLFLYLLNTDTYENPAWTERRTRTRKTEECTKGERCGLNVCVVPSLNGRVPFNLREGERYKRSTAGETGVD